MSHQNIVCKPRTGQWCSRTLHLTKNILKLKLGAAHIYDCKRTINKDTDSQSMMQNNHHEHHVQSHTTIDYRSCVDEF